jgi:hypothetical protein
LKLFFFVRTRVDGRQNGLGVRRLCHVGGLGVDAVRHVRLIAAKFLQQGDGLGELAVGQQGQFQRR